jgi:hypothetical protein
MKTFKNKINNFNPGFMPKLKQLNIKKPEQNFNSIIHENEYENLTNSSYDVVNTFKDKTKYEIKENKEEAKIGEEEEEDTKSNIKKEEKTSSTFKKNDKTNSTKKDEKTNSTIKKEEKTNSAIKEEKEEKSDSGKEEDKKDPNNNNENLSKLFKGLDPSNEEKNNNFFNLKENKISNTTNRAINPPIYQMTNTNEGGMIRALSRKTIMRKKKSKTANKYDFLI